MNNFIELTMPNDQKVIGNINLLQVVFKRDNGNSYVVGWSNNGGFEVKESYEEIKRKINEITTKN